jgi:hypothetical protein
MIEMANLECCRRIATGQAGEEEKLMKQIANSIQRQVGFLVHCQLNH